MHQKQRERARANRTGTQIGHGMRMLRKRSEVKSANVANETGVASAGIATQAIYINTAN